MRRMVVLSICLACIALNATGCACSSWCCCPTTHKEQELIDAENRKPVTEEWRRPGMSDQPDGLTPYRIHGGVGPASSSI